ncbi:acidic leucine-rich nuclear phosphoprotein 32 family member A [Tanacetum coccineum]
MRIYMLVINIMHMLIMLDGLFEFIAHCKPLLHPIKEKIRCPCSRCCNCDKLVTLKTLEIHISEHGFDPRYTTWTYHGEPILPLPPPVPHSPEDIDMDAFFEDISANNVPTPLTQTTGPQPAQTTGPNNEFEELLSRIKADHYAKHTSPNEAKNHSPPPKVWGETTQDDWNELVDWWSAPDRVSRSLQNAANRAKNTIITHQGKKSFAQGRNEYKVDKGYYEDLIETWRKGHSNKKTGEFKTKENEQRYLDMKAMKDKITAGLIPFKIDQEILDEIIPSDNCQNMSGMGRKLPGGGSTSRKRANRAFGDIMTPDQITQMFRQQEQEKELYMKQAEEAQARAYLASLKADVSNQWANVVYQNSEAINAALVEQLAQDLARENNNESSSGEEEEGEQQSGGDDDYSDEDE